VLLAAAVLITGGAVQPTAAAEVRFPATPGIPCDRGSLPETVQGWASPADFASGRARRGYSCNVQLVSYTGLTGGFRVERYVDAQKHVCAFYDSSRLIGADLGGQLAGRGAGVYAVDMTDPAHPVVTANLVTPAMLSPHESLRLNQKRGLLVADVGTPATAPGIVEVYDVSQDCRHPKLLSSYPLGLLGHESAFAPDGRTFYVTSNMAMMAAIDLTDPTAPNLLWYSTDWGVHGASISNDGNTLYAADTGDPGLTVLDVSEIQQRRPNPQVHQLSHLTWPEVSIPQNATPFSSRGHRYLVETDEFGGGDADTPVGGARIVNIDNPRRPKVVSRLRLAVHNLPETSFSAHYCTVPSRVDPYIIACGMINSGLRVFDVRDVARPREVAYSNYLQYGEWLSQVTGNPNDQTGSAFAAPAYDPARNDIWYTDGLRGFFVVHLTPASGVKRFARTYVLPGS
jgi:hypothetical protein